MLASCLTILRIPVSVYDALARTRMCRSLPECPAHEDYSRAAVKADEDVDTPIMRGLVADATWFTAARYLKSDYPSDSTISRPKT
ncbi:MAG: hypothetical protein NUW37_06525, partial [Planctomycetes bacterium]|nr:hypothetical protein [Planctomycetota bacterium]